jgi:drug/metabolite transporter (DMT)-like permease
MIAVALAALSGLVWGAGDFLGGKATQRTPALVTAVLSKAASLPLLGLYLALLPAAAHTASLGWGAVAGLFGMSALVVFYRALSTGSMAIVAPVSAVTAAVVPLVVGLVIEQPPGPVPLAGAGCAVVAIALVSVAGNERASERTMKHREVVRFDLRLVGLALASGAGFGMFFVFLKRAGDAAGGDPGLWPVLASQAAALTLGGVLLLRARRSVALPRGGVLVLVVSAGVLDMTANALYLLAVQGGLLSIVAPVASLYPVSTVLLAMLVDRERMRPVQIAGLGLAVTALVMVAS